MDPCERKTTRPSPVFAPSRQEENTKELQDLVNITNLIEREIEKEMQNNINDTSNPKILKRILEGENEGGSDVMKKQKLNPEDCFLLDFDLQLSDAEMGLEGSSKTANSSSASPKTKKGFKTPSTVSPTPSEIDELEMEKQNIKEQNFKEQNFKEQNFKAIREAKIIFPLKTMDGRRQCKHEYKKGDKKGERCEKYCKGDFCPVHKLKPDNYSNKAQFEDVFNKKQEMERKMSHLESLILKQDANAKQDREKIAKLERIVTILRLDREKCRTLEKEVNALKQSIRDVQTNSQEMSNKVGYILDKEKPKNLNNKPVEYRRMHKLDKTKKYDVIQMKENEVVLACGNHMVKTKIPKDMKKPDFQNKSKLVLNYNTAEKMFQWAEA